MDHKQSVSAQHFPGGLSAMATVHTCATSLHDENNPPLSSKIIPIFEMRKHRFLDIKCQLSYKENHPDTELYEIPSKLLKR